MRSLLFVPGDSPRKQQKGLESGADALILDLEDSVALDAKSQAREITRAFLDSTHQLPKHPRLIVRINALTTARRTAAMPILIALPDRLPCSERRQRKSRRSTLSSPIFGMTLRFGSNASQLAAMASPVRWRSTRHRSHQSTKSFRRHRRLLPRRRRSLRFLKLILTPV